jgi:putative protease
MELVDGRGQTLVRDKHLLSLRDMNRSGELEALIAAGVTSLKIEGRLKDMAYVKNVTAYYRRRLDALLEGHPEWAAASDGHCTYTFEPRPSASFNRGFTSYYAEGRRDTEAGRAEVIWSPDTPKSMGERIGQVGQVGRDWLTCRPEDAAQAALTLANGDGLVAQTADGTIRGFRLNRYEAETQRLYPAGGGEVCRQLRPGMALYRNADAQLERLLAKPSAQRKLYLDMELSVSRDGLTLRLTDETGAGATQELEGPFEPARTPQQENYRRQLTKLGDTYYILRAWTYSAERPDAPDYFIPSSVLTDLRRQALEGLEESRNLYQEALRSGRPRHPPDRLPRQRHEPQRGRPDAPHEVSRPGPRLRAAPGPPKPRHVHATLSEICARMLPEIPARRRATPRAVEPEDRRTEFCHKIWLQK